MIRFLRLPQVVAKVGFCPMTIWRREKARTFPRRVKLGPNSVAWVEQEIEAWCAERAAERDARTGADSPQSSAEKAPAKREWSQRAREVH